MGYKLPRWPIKEMHQMSDIVERLRQQAWQRSGAPKMDAGHTKMLEWEAADEIERLRGEQVYDRNLIKVLSTEIKRLRAGLCRLFEQDYDAGYSPEDYAQAILEGHR